MFALIYGDSGGSSDLRRPRQPMMFSPSCREMLEAARLVPADAVAFDDELSVTPANLALSVEELTAMKEEVEQVAAAQPWANHRNWMGKAIERAIAAKAGRL